MERLIKLLKEEIEDMKSDNAYDKTEIILTKEDCEIILKALENQNK